MLPHMSNHKDHLALGIALSLLAWLLFAAISFFAKLLGDTHDGLEIMFYRHVFSLLTISAILFFTQNAHKFKTTKPKAQFLRAALGTMTGICLFSSLRFLDLSETTSLFFTAPLFVIPLSLLFLKEKTGIFRISFTVLGFAGALLILWQGDISSSLGGALALSAAFFNALVVISLRWLGNTEAPETTTFYFAFYGFLLTGLFMPFAWTPPALSDVPVFILIGVTATLAQLCYSKSYIHMDASVAAPLTYTKLIWALLLDILIWQAWPTSMVLTGAAIIIASNLLILWREQKAQKHGRT